MTKCLDPLVRGGCLALCLSLICEVDFVLALSLPLVRGCIVEERSYVLSNCIYSNPQWRFPMWEVLCGRVMKILLCEGRDVELCARASKHILVFAFDPLSLTLSHLCCALHHSYCSFILICLVVFVCVPHLSLTKRASYSTSTLI